MKTFLAFLLGITVCYIPARIGQANQNELVEKAERDTRIAKSERDDAIQEYEALMNSLPELHYMGEFKITYYCPCESCSGEWGTALAYPCEDNHKAMPYHSIAVDPDVIPIGSTVVINGIYYTAEDVGSAVKGKIIDVYVESHEETIRNGVDYENVFIVEER